MISEDTKTPPSFQTPFEQKERPELIAVIGGLGYIGQHVCDELFNQGLKYIIIDNASTGIPTDEFVQCDITDFDALSKVFTEYGITKVINLAAIVGEPACKKDVQRAMITNVQGVINVKKICDEHNVKIVHASTCSVYGAPMSGEINATNCPFTEEDSVHPIDFYGLTKYFQENTVQIPHNWAHNSVLLRFGTAYGQSPRMRYDLVVNRFAAMSKFKTPLGVFGGEAYRPFTHCHDLARACVFGLSLDPGIYNVANENMKIIDLAKLICDKTGNTMTETPVEDARNYVVSSKKIIGAGFRFKYTVADTVDEIIENVPEDWETNPIYHNVLK